VATLCLLGEDGAVVQRWEIGDQPVAIGRDDTADVRIVDDALSRRHFMIWREAEHYLIKDLNSENGTWVDGQRAQGTQLKQNDCILAGRTLFLFHEQPLPAAAGLECLPRAHDSAFLPAAAAAERTARRAAHNLSLEQTG
jgi:pSer/pThr/pTyr-binding forkhead associated (FHA) protein